MFPSHPPQESAEHCLKKDTMLICWMCSSDWKIRRNILRMSLHFRDTVLRSRGTSEPRSRIWKQSGLPARTSPTVFSARMSSSCAAWRISHFSGSTEAKARTESCRRPSTSWESATPVPTHWAALWQWTKGSPNRYSFSPA